MPLEFGDEGDPFIELHRFGSQHQGCGSMELVMGIVMVRVLRVGFTALCVKLIQTLDSQEQGSSTQVEFLRPVLHVDDERTTLAQVVRIIDFSREGVSHLAIKELEGIGECRELGAFGFVHEVTILRLVGSTLKTVEVVSEVGDLGMVAGRNFEFRHFAVS